MPRKRVGTPLTLRQQERVRTARADRIARCDADFLLAGGAGAPGAEEEGRVVAHFGLNVEVEDAAGARCRCAVRETLPDHPVCGDRVVWCRVGQEQGVIVEVRARTSFLQRPGPYQRLLTVAANVDRIVVVAASGTLNVGLLDRYLAAARKAAIDAILVINKADRAGALPPEEEEALAPYPRMGYGVFKISALLGLGLEPLAEALRDKTSVLVGESGVGKSSLVNCWTHGSTAKTAAVHPGTGQGRHVTTTAQLHHLPGGGALIDSPGVREFGLHGVERESVPRLFRDVAPFLGKCRFSDCRHQQEPDCALRAAVAAGEIAPARLASMLRIMESLPARNPY